jgi:hypothetical protein
MSSSSGSAQSLLRSASSFTPSSGNDFSEACLAKEQTMGTEPNKRQPDIPQPPDIQPERPDIQPEPRHEEIPPAPDVPEKESPPMSVRHVSSN